MKVLRQQPLTFKKKMETKILITKKNGKKVKVTKKKKTMIQLANRTFKHMASKGLRKLVKQIKSFVTQKLVRKIKEIKSSTDSSASINLQLKKLLNKLEEIKGLDHEVLGDLIFQIGFETKTNESTDKTSITNDITSKYKLSSSLFNEIYSHKKMKQLIQDLHDKRDKTYEKIKERQAIIKEKLELNKSKISNTKKLFKNVFTDVAMNGKATDKAIFVESLSSVEEEPIEESKVHIRNNSGKRKDSKKVDLSIYMPQNMRTISNSKNLRTLKSSGKVTRVDEAKIQDENHTIDKISNNRVIQKLQDPKRHNSIDNFEVNKEVIANGKDWKKTGLHPSWAAKKITPQVSINSFAGKKIKFDDD